MKDPADALPNGKTKYTLRIATRKSDANSLRNTQDYLMPDGSDDLPSAQMAFIRARDWLGAANLTAISAMVIDASGGHVANIDGFGRVWEPGPPHAGKRPLLERPTLPHFEFALTLSGSVRVEGSDALHARALLLRHFDGADILIGKLPSGEELRLEANITNAAPVTSDDSNAVA